MNEFWCVWYYLWWNIHIMAHCFVYDTTRIIIWQPDVWIIIMSVNAFTRWRIKQRKTKWRHMELKKQINNTIAKQSQEKEMKNTKNDNKHHLFNWKYFNCCCCCCMWVRFCFNCCCCFVVVYLNFKEMKKKWINGKLYSDLTRSF